MAGEGGRRFCLIFNDRGEEREGIDRKCRRQSHRGGRARTGVRAEPSNRSAGRRAGEGVRLFESGLACDLHQWPELLLRAQFQAFGVPRKPCAAELPSLPGSGAPLALLPPSHSSATAEICVIPLSILSQNCVETLPRNVCKNSQFPLIQATKCPACKEIARLYPAVQQF